MSLEEYEIGPPGPGVVLVKTLYSLISPGTETAFLAALPNTPKKFPQYPGYSNAGIIIALGEGVKGLDIGDKVVSPSPHASLVLVKEDRLFKIPPEVPPEEATFFNLISIALQGIRKAQLEIGESVAVLGLGLVGQLAAQLARACGAIPVIGIDYFDYRLKIAAELGVDYVVRAADGEVVSKVLEITKGKGADVVIEATGSPDAIPIAFRIAKWHGRVVLLGSTRGVNLVNFYSDVHRKGLIVIGAHNSVRPKYESHKYFWTHRDDCLLALELLARKRIRVKELISLIMSFREAPLAYDKLMRSKNEVVGIVLDWREAPPKAIL